MSDKPENPPAFPLKYQGRGMSLRDYFAGQALAGLCSITWKEGTTAEDIARMAYADADAMLKERTNDK